MRTKIRSSVAAAVLMTGLLALPVISAAQNTDQKSDLDELLKQRRDTLRKLVEVVTDQYRVGERSFDSVVQAKDRLIEAELEMAQTRQERLSLLRQQVQMFESLSETIDKRFQLGLARESEFLKVRAAVLDARIRLVRAQAESGDDR